MKFLKFTLIFFLAGLTFSACKKEKPEANFSYTNNGCDSTGCSVTFTNTSINADEYTWHFGDNSTSTDGSTTIEHIYAQAGTYTVKLVASGNKNQNEIEKTVIVGTGCNYEVIEIKDNINTPTIWESCKVYVITRAISLNNTLTIQPGAIVKLKAGVSIGVNAGGTFNAQGTEAKPIFFTSYKDDAHGGDSNGDGAATVASARDWKDLYIASGGSIFKHCKFLYGGSTNVTVTLFLTNATFENCVFANNYGETNFKGALDLSKATDGTIVKGNIFYSNMVPLSISTAFSLDNSNTFHNPADAGKINKFNGIFVEDAQSEGNFSWAETEVPFVQTTLYFSSTLTIEPGVIVKGKGSSSRIQLSDNGKIIANGTATNPIIFTSFEDDAYGGDTNADGTSTSPQPKGWTDILLNGTNGSQFNHCNFYYGGNSTKGSTLDMWGSVATVRNCLFVDNFGGGSIETSAVLDASRAADGTVIESNTFYNNIRPLSISSAINLDGSNIFHNPENTSQKNTFQAILVSWDFSTTKPMVIWGETEVAYVVQQGSNLDMPSGKTLEVANGVVIKIQANSRIIFRSSPTQLINHENAIFTSYKDDTRGGDSNGNGAANAPAAGDWDGIYDDKTSTWLTWPNIYYAK